MREPRSRVAPCSAFRHASAHQHGSEERQVTFVACARANEDIILAIHKDTHVALERVRPELLLLFESIKPLPRQAARHDGS